MEYGELHIQPERKYTNPLNGQFLKGHTPHNKGKKWSDYAGKRAQKRMAKGWANLDKYRSHPKPEKAGTPPKKVVAVADNGSWMVFNSVVACAFAFGVGRENVGRCCRENNKRRVNKKTGKINTDHKYKGIRFYFETDFDLWGERIKGE